MLSGLGPNNEDQDKMGYISRKKHPITEEGDDDQDNTGNKKVKTNSPNTEADSSSSDNSCFVASVTVSNLHEDSLCLPPDFTISNGFKRKCRKIVLADERERSWALDLRFNKSSDTFYITRGWRNFCEENGKKAGSLFKFKLMRNGETPLLSVCPTESTSDGTQGDENNPQRCRDSTSPNQNRFVTLTLTNDSLKSSRLYLPLPFLKENGMDKPGMVTLLGKDGTRRLANLLRENSGRMSLGKGLKDFARANGLNMGDSFTLELIWENATPVLSLLSTEFRSQNRLVTLTLTQDSFKNSRLGLPLPFMRENGMNEPGTIALLGKDGTKWMTNLLRESQGRMSLGKGWKDFARANGLEIGESFTLESIWEGATPMLGLSSRESKSEKVSVSTEPNIGNETKKDENNIEE
ncbi:B3 domain-containing protein REM12 [Raphanus sativus]|uniref:B3 domain-containing protein REM12 n=1 Tax=Raphanus sativus TaxID=3726 RepID=A0A9W3DF63_RAPSA|nr:B3 domain-containing protein REM12 [Raphanus sativus]XP_056862541.1 B3 domain-containing protein REM12 [Raphanus sativus]XP_056862542.1 B3 domain-containing protein REM12 [Raphanus sativus]XP_056862544.1 B3 domain-containing protein REM12 [Raphanus sativus]KAJ4906167.1 B3 domain-containing protein REM12 [Raphanus sativus]